MRSKMNSLDRAIYGFMQECEAVPTPELVRKWQLKYPNYADEIEEFAETMINFPDNPAEAVNLPETEDTIKHLVSSAGRHLDAKQHKRGRADTFINRL